MARRKKTRRFRRNPGGFNLGRVGGGLLFMPKGILKDAGLAAAGALGVNLIINKVPFLPAALKTGYGRLVSKAALSLIGAGIAKKALGPRGATAFAIGGLATVLMDVFNLFSKPKTVSGFADYAIDQDVAGLIDGTVGAFPDEEYADSYAVNGFVQ